MDISKLLVNNTEIVTNYQKPIEKKRHACTWSDCIKTFSRPSDMTRHYRIHTNDRPYQCPLEFCGKRFIQRSALTVHERTHSGEKPHICQFISCNKSFSDSSSLARHRRIHSQTRSYVCKVLNCSKNYTKKSHLTRHIRRSHSSIETGEKKYHMNTRASKNNLKLVYSALSITSDDEEEEEEEEIHENVMYEKNPTSSTVVHPNCWLTPQFYNYTTRPTLYDESTNYYPSFYYPH